MEANATRDERPARDAVATIYYRNSVGEELRWNVAAVLGADDPDSLEGLLKRWRPDCKFLGATIEATGWERKWEAEERAESAERALDELRAAARVMLERSPIYVKNDNARCTIYGCMLTYATTKHREWKFVHHPDCPWQRLSALVHGGEAPDGVWLTRQEAEAAEDALGTYVEDYGVEDDMTELVIECGALMNRIRAALAAHEEGQPC